MEEGRTYYAPGPAQHDPRSGPGYQAPPPYGQPGPYPPPQGGPGYQMKPPGRLERFLAKPATQAFLRRNQKSLMATLIAILIAVLFLTIGFFQTLLILILGSLGYTIGSFLDRKPWVFILLERLRRY